MYGMEGINNKRCRSGYTLSEYVLILFSKQSRQQTVMALFFASLSFGRKSIRGERGFWADSP
jgi:hypothetical protein